MTVNINTYADISSLVNTIWEDAMLIARENSILPSLVRNFNDQQGMAVRKNAKYGSGATISQVGESDDLTSQAFTPSADQTLTPYEYAGQYFITDTRMETDQYNVKNDAANDLGLALGGTVDALLASKFSSLTGGTVGAAGADMTWTTFFNAMTKMRRALAPRPWVCVLTPEQWGCMGTAISPGVTVTNSPYLQDEFARQYFVQNVGGVDIFLSANIATGTSVFGAMFSTVSLALDWRRAPRLEPQRDASRRGIELNLSSVFAYGPWRPQYGIAINTAGTAPA
jgi:hypothetical protein